MRVTRRLITDICLLLAIAVVLAYAAVASSFPLGAESITIQDSQRADRTTGYNVNAEAGNVTEMDINATGVTKHWAGFYGNVTGYLTLDDADNYTMYDWYVAEPQGEVYATVRNPPSWTSVDCLNHSSPYNFTDLEINLSMEPNDVDGVNETFCPGCNESYKELGVDPPVNHSEFFVGTKQFFYQDCWAIATYVNDDPQGATPDFVEVLLTDGTDAIYVTIIEDDSYDAQGDKNGFDNTGHDFQIMVGEDGNGTGVTTTTPYYFYIELE